MRTTNLFLAMAVGTLLFACSQDDTDSSAGVVATGGTRTSATVGASSLAGTGGTGISATGGTSASTPAAGTISVTSSGGSATTGGSSAGGTSATASTQAATTGGATALATTAGSSASVSGGSSASGGGTNAGGATNGGVSSLGGTGGSGAPTLGVSVAPGSSTGTATVTASLCGSTDSITKVSVTVSPDNVSASADADSVQMTGLLADSTHTFEVTVTTGTGKTIHSTSNPLAFYDVIETFTEPECMANTVFTGAFTFDTTDKTVSNLSGILTECMYDGPPTISLGNQLSSVSTLLDSESGWLVATFALTTTPTFVDGSWTPGGINTYGNDNAYALVFVPANDPTQSLTTAQIDWLAYADCTPDGLMGSACMTGTTVAAYGRVGTMMGYPTSQITTER